MHEHLISQNFNVSLCCGLVQTWTVDETRSSLFAFCHLFNSPEKPNPSICPTQSSHNMGQSPLGMMAKELGGCSFGRGCVQGHPLWLHSCLDQVLITPLKGWRNVKRKLTHLNQQGTPNPRICPPSHSTTWARASWEWWPKDCSFVVLAGGMFKDIPCGGGTTPSSRLHPLPMEWEWRLTLPHTPVGQIVWGANKCSIAQRHNIQARLKGYDLRANGEECCANCFQGVRT